MKKLYYIHDPMCSWCWGFNDTWGKIKNALEGKLEIQTVVGGLAADSEQAMPQEMQLMLQNTWRNIQACVPGTEFNFNFWNECQPRRSTYPACRAVLAAKKQNKEHEMVLAIQSAYYLNARNPSDISTLCAIAAEIGLNPQRFADDMSSPEIDKELHQELDLSRALGAQGFPSLVFASGPKLTLLELDYNSADRILEQIDLS